MHPLKDTPQSPRLLTETEMTASQFPRERDSEALAPPSLWTTSLLNVRFATNCHAPTLLLLDTARRAAACRGLLICCQSANVSSTFPFRLWGWGDDGGWGCRLSVTAEWNDCRSFLTEFDRCFQTVQTGRYGYINRRARSSCPLFLFLCLSRVMRTHRHVHVWTWGGGEGRTAEVTSYQLHRGGFVPHNRGHLNLVKLI